MDWKSKASSWDFAQFQQGTIPNMDFLNGSSGINSERSSGEFLVDLKLGQMGNSGDQDKWKELMGSKTTAAASSVKRARAANGGTFPASCLVDGCDSDLSNCREYHRRHKVCEKHSKTPQVTIAGHKKRFCQQCSRFHSLEEFDEEKRSCRKRLDGHNRRRRKPQPETPLHSGSYLSRYRGMEFSPFSSPAMYPAATAVRAAWPGSPDHHHKQQLRLLEKQVPFHGPSSSSCCLGGGTTQFTFLQGSDPFAQARASTSAGTPPGHGLLADELLGQVPDSPRAPSLLSLPQSRTSGVGLVRLQQPSFPGTQYESIRHMVSEDAARAPDGADARCEGMFRVEPGSKAPETIPFYWEEQQQQHKCSGHHMNRGSF